MAEYTLDTLLHVARTLTRHRKVDVHIGGDRAFSSYNDGVVHINVPMIRETPEAFALARGYIDHEAGHALLTDFDFLKVEKPSPLLQSIWNVFEDGRVERRMGESWPGCEYNLHKLNDLLFNAHDKAPITGSPTDYILLATIAQSQSMQPLASAREKLAANMPALDLDALDAIINQVPNAVSTQATLDLAKQAVALLESQGQEGQGQEGQGQEGQGQEGQGQREGQAQDSTGADDAAGDDTGDGADYRVTDVDIKASRINQALCFNINGSTTVGYEYTPSSNKTGLAGATYLRDEIYLEALKASSAMQARLTSLLQSYSYERRLPSLRGRIDGRKVCRAGFDARVFRRQERARGLDTEVIILADTSSSMAGMPIELLSGATYATLRCLRTIRGVTSSLALFSGSFSHVLTPAQPLTRTHAQFCANGGTMLATALLDCIQCFQDYERRNIILVMTDGDTYDQGDMPYILRNVKRMGIEVYGIGMRYDGLSAYEDLPSVCIYTMNDLPKAMFNMLSDALLQGVA